MSANQISKLAQGIVFGALFMELGGWMRFWAESGTSIFYGGKVASIMGALIMVWGVVEVFRPQAKQR